MAIINVYAHEIQRGDYIQRTRENGKSYAGSSYVQAVQHHGDTVEILTASGIHDNWTTYGDTVPVWIDRD